VQSEMRAGEVQMRDIPGSELDHTDDVCRHCKKLKLSTAQISKKTRSRIVELCDRQKMKPIESACRHY